ncbi:poly-gamma-glutamate biosynthesis protein PgsC/CapC [Polyangium aurulentum]|uniref:poly-gamma-glutamate biosynthesis protein PgsC/CapC n=1 Tax=Polyangium aurulentum TaxID=2567896 RepID=UPI0010ADCF97|nr:poly-gamma-glutamate biosynthesis protein PgsC/CapC [Polyangium aurulentum]UQA62888.1 poly-gamma-glutamate biosynthesis protein PgsC/CapC [Polyangium aurulentum]
MVAALAVFPPNGLDRSLHVAVLLGLVLGTAFTELFGWTYAGLVVPGYLATIFIAAPATAIFIVVESVVTYWLVAGVGRWVTHLGAWSAAFGRERFYLFIVGAVLVRLLFEGVLIPRLEAQYNFAHSRELYSVGLVLVPLVSNTFWNAGIIKAFPRVGFVTVLTWVILVLLLRGTNLSVSRFQVINESLSIKFLESPKAQMILVIGALLGARNNVKYGWDYNGILVPGLLAVACYEPLKLVTTTVEALIVFFASKFLMSVPPFSRMLIVGPRRMLMCYITGFVLKMIMGFALARFAPGVPMIDYFGFGYLLPSLLAVKMWNKDHIGIVVMPTLQVSVTAFLVGNLLGYGLVKAEALLHASTPPMAVVSMAGGANVPYELILGDSGPRPRALARAAGVEAAVVALALAREVDTYDEANSHLPDAVPREEASPQTLTAAQAAGLVVMREERGGWVVVRPRASELDPDDVPPGPRFAVRPHKRPGAHAGRGGWMILVTPRTAGSPLPTVAYAAADALGARAIVVVSRHEGYRQLDEAFADNLSRDLALDQTLVIEPTDEEAPGVSAVGSVPEGLDVMALGRVLGEDVPITWRAPASGPSLMPWSDAPHLRMPLPLSEEVAGALLGSREIEVWTGGLRQELLGRIAALTSVGAGGYRGPTVEELRLFDAVLARRMATAGAEPRWTSWERAMAARLGYGIVRVEGEGSRLEAWGLVEESVSGRRGNASWFIKVEHPGDVTAPGDILVEVPAPRWETGTFGAGLSLYDALGARGLLVSGALPSSDPQGHADPRRRTSRRSFFQRAHEVWLGEGKSGVSVQGIAPERDYTGDLVISFGFEVIRREQVPAWAKPMVEVFSDLGLRVGMFDGAREHASYSGSADLAMSYARRFADGRFAVLYMSGDLRSALSALEDEGVLSPRLSRLGIELGSEDVAARAVELAACPAGTAKPADKGDKAQGDKDDKGDKAQGDKAQGATADKAEGTSDCPAYPPDTPSKCDIDKRLSSFELYLGQNNPFDLRAAMKPDKACHVEVARDKVTRRIWAIVARPGEVAMIPLGSNPVPRAPNPLTSLPRVRRAVATGLTSVKVTVGP